MNENIVFPGEFQPHLGTIIMYPFRNDIWRDNAGHMQRYICDLANTISKYEHVFMICHPEHEFIINGLSTINTTIVNIKYNDIWARDIAPTYIKQDGKTVCINWKFNAWGGKKEGAYFPWDDDDAFAKEIAAYQGYDCRNVDLILEGGAIISDGNGTIFTTRSVLLNRNRNPFKKFTDVDNLLKATLGAKKIIWLEHGLMTDETNGHIDNVLSVIRPGEICVSWTEDKSNPNYKRLCGIYSILSSNYDGTIYKIPLPPAQYMTIEEENGLVHNNDSIKRKAGDLLPASYLNFNYVNGGVIIPAFGCKEDEIVREMFGELFPDRIIEQIYSREPLLGGGGIHCLLHEIPL